MDSTDCNKLGRFIYTGKIQPLTASTDRGRTDACTLQKARGRESQEEISISEVSKWKREKHRRRRLEERQREGERERRELSKGEKSRHVLLTSQEQKDTEREGERDRGQRTSSAEQLVHQRSSICSEGGRADGDGAPPRSPQQTLRCVRPALFF